MKGTATNPAIWLVLNPVLIFLPLSTGHGNAFVRFRGFSLQNRNSLFTFLFNNFPSFTESNSPEWHSESEFYYPSDTDENVKYSICFCDEKNLKIKKTDAIT